LVGGGYGRLSRRYWDKPRNTLIRIAGSPAEIWTWYLPKEIQ
jgi:hypothetical protein